MANYVKSTNFATKDALLSGNPAKIIKGTEIDDEYNAIAVAVSTKADLVSPTFTGTPAAPTAAGGTNTTQIATTAFATTASTAAVTAERTATATLTNKTLTSPTINGGTISGITDLTVADGGTGVSALTADNVILGDGTNPVKFVAPGTSGNVLTSNGTTWESSSLTTAINNVLSGASAGNVGTYALLATSSVVNVAADTNYAGSGLRYYSGPAANGGFDSEVHYSLFGGTPSGTWKAMGAGTPDGVSKSSYTVFLRVA